MDMSDFEKIYITDPSRENLRPMEKNIRIEISDEEIAAKAIGRVLMDINEISSMTDEVKSDEKGKGESSKRKSKKNHRMSDKAAVESIQKKLS